MEASAWFARYGVTTTSWGVLLSEHQRQRLAKQSLTSAGVDHFMPMVEEVHVVSGRHVHRLNPLLGRYVLFAVDEFWKSVARLRGVAGLLLTAEYFPALVNVEQLEALRSMCVNGVYNKRVVETKRGLVYGQRVTPSTGPLYAHVGRYDGMASKHREAAVFTLFGRDQRLMFKAGDLLAA
jgi:transcription antitermination factor NusG